MVNERRLKSELWLCHEHMKMTMVDLYNLPVSDRHDFIKIHNKVMKEQKAKMGGK